MTYIYDQYFTISEMDNLIASLSKIEKSYEMEKLIFCLKKTYFFPFPNDSNIHELEEEIEELNQTIDGLETEIDELNDKVEELEAEIDER